MSYIVEHKNTEKKDQRKSAIITFLISLLVLLALYFYKFTRDIPKQEEAITTMLINFGDETNGNITEEPANQEGSEAAEPIPTPQPEPKPIAQPKPEPVAEKVITGNNPKTMATKVEKTEKKQPKPLAVKSTEKTSTKKTTETKSAKTPTKKAAVPKATTAAKKTEGDSRGTAAVGNLIRGRGTANASQGNSGTTGNAGDPLGGNSNGDSKIGVDRKLIAFIPGTMGRGGAQPAHNCTASGTISISYTVDKSGNVISARRSGGISDPCVSSTTVAWVKQYVKAERANTNSTGVYRITF